MRQSRKPRWAAVAILTVKCGVAVGIGCLSGELMLRLLFWDGVSFGSHYGPIVKRFERDFVFNRYDGPSRGPETPVEKRLGAIHVLVQGDSITWGQGIKKEKALFTNRLRSLLQSKNPGVEVAALAYPGRDLDGHLEQLRKWKASVAPDAIVYQWFFNDLRMGRADCQRRPPPLPWRQFPLYRDLIWRSYLAFYLDTRLPLLKASAPVLEPFLAAQVRSEGPCWQDFIRMFQEWTSEAKAETPRILVALYPGELSSVISPEHQELRDAMIGLCQQAGVANLDLAQSLQVFAQDYAEAYASPYDGHPGERAHARIAEGLSAELERLWPELFP